MSHHHDHDNEHDHDHEHDHSHEHHHGHAHDTQGTLSFEEKMIKLLEHWIKHNDEHADSYRDWSEKAKEQGMQAAGALLEEVAELTGSITGKFKRAMETMKK